jgi:hypothetical protein
MLSTFTSKCHVNSSLLISFYVTRGIDREDCRISRPFANSEILVQNVLDVATYRLDLWGFTWGLLLDPELDKYGKTASCDQHQQIY